MTVPDPDVEQRYLDACRSTGEQLVLKVRTLQKLYWETSALHPEIIVVLAGTSLVAALVTAGKPRAGDVAGFLKSWTYDRRTGEIRHVAMRARMIAVEDPDLGEWDYRLMVPTDADMLGRPTVERGTINPNPEAVKK